ncbi:hypothetical protein LptCag_1617 [Leptospirillum ferriphilum]|jgi:uncharacterized protein YjgD (DUF1641 family)|uniref:DUF1641 domain-containing protein n=3 Tax=Leptospirillum TaxID=179 RepID=A0A094W5P7_9BACT|nr:MAG: Protein of unknown function [Leptospirillum sp. Group II '5-way CG']KGA92783.1 hypothetical protein LptCag_1617 [Leptospirillum ferriphilum]
MGVEKMEKSDSIGALGKKIGDLETEKALLSLLDRVKVLEEAQIAGKAVWDIQTNSIIERLADSVEKASLLLDRLTSPEILLLMERIEKSAPRLLQVFDEVDLAEKTGAFRSLAELGGAVRAIQLMGVDTLVERVALQAERASEMMGHIENLPLKDMTETLNRMRELGTFEAIPEIAAAVTAIRRLLTDSLVERVMSLLETAISWQGNVYNILKQIPPSPEIKGGGMMGMLRLLSHPETQETLAFFLTGMKQVKQAMKA